MPLKGLNYAIITVMPSGGSSTLIWAPGHIDQVVIVIKNIA